MPEEEVGKVKHYYGKLGVAIVELAKPLKVGEQVHIKGSHSDFAQAVDSMQIEHASVTEAKPGDCIGLKVKEHAREHDTVFRVTP